ncbi:conjugal transfer protein TraX [Paenibacillus sp. P96]|uniref:Conjugal transfer protein TraX n=1 Tax=Paenibacillus zeirhizosphaerae TaxID=2987519 RepID=A0ABT9FS89_9BACL|nr:TraX family protein [Paenibacillus sp. P96]MDP4097604.1 conjugal transfer protein TraX [Paenibacillus sp. P96]
MHWIAMITMLIDHVGAVFYPNELAPWRIIGRIAFPIYTFALYLGFLHTRNMKRYMLRLFVLAVLSQLPFMLAFETVGLNVIFTLLISLLALVGADKLKKLALVIPFYMIVGAFMEWSNMDYGAYGLGLVLIFRYTRGGWMVVSHLMLNLLYELWNYRYIGYMYYRPFTVVQHYSLISTVVISLFQSNPAVFRRMVPRWLWISFYPVHLAVIALVFMDQAGFETVLQNIVQDYYLEFK